MWSIFHDSNLGPMTDNVGAVSKGHPTYTKPLNEYIKRTSYLKIRSISNLQKYYIIQN